MTKVTRKNYPPKFTKYLYDKKVDGDIQPFVDFYPLKKTDSPKGGVLILPGGGYCVCVDHEWANIAKKYNQLGFHAFVLSYRVAPVRFPAPQLDVFAAIKMIRAMSGEINLDPHQLAVCGFSAGGHLAACAGTLYEELATEAERPDAMILGYPVISFKEHGHKGSGENLFGELTNELMEKYSLENRVTPQTPPTFLWHTADDQVVSVNNSLCFAERLHNNNVLCELHVFPHGPHGMNLAIEEPSVAIWAELSMIFLVEHCNFDTLNT